MTLRPTIRLRLTAWYAGLFLACGAVLLGVSYAVVREAFEPEVERRSAPAPQGPAASPAGSAGGSVRPAQEPAEIERRVLEEERERDEQALRDVLAWFAGALGALTLGSVGVGWVVAGRALSPVSRITATAQRVSAARLDQRIALDGPPD